MTKDGRNKVDIKSSIAQKARKTFAKKRNLLMTIEYWAIITKNVCIKCGVIWE